MKVDDLIEYLDDFKFEEQVGGVPLSFEDIILIQEALKEYQSNA